MCIWGQAIAEREEDGRTCCRKKKKICGVNCGSREKIGESCL